LRGCLKGRLVKKDFIREIFPDEPAAISAHFFEISLALAARFLKAAKKDALNVDVIRL
jgi:hypothetical protein